MLALNFQERGALGFLAHGRGKYWALKVKESDQNKIVVERQTRTTKNMEENKGFIHKNQYADYKNNRSDIQEVQMERKYEKENQHSVRGMSRNGWTAVLVVMRDMRGDSWNNIQMGVRKLVKEWSTLLSFQLDQALWWCKESEGARNV